jgi:hypothetical protein
LGQVTHLARDVGSNKPLFAEVLGVTLGLQLCLDGLQAVVEVIDLGIKGAVSIDLCNEVPLIQIVNSCTEDGVVGLRPP